MNGYIMLQLIVVVLCFYMPYCDAADLGNACDTNTDTCTGSNVECNTNGGTTGTCGCTNAGYVVNTINDTDCTAVIRLGGSGCIPNQSNTCVGSNIQCNSGGACECVTGFYDDNGSTSGGTCTQKRDSGESCTETSQCSAINSQCTSSGGTLICLCQSGYYGIGTGPGGTCEKRSLGQTCSAASQCITNNVVCSSATCQCQSGYYDTVEGIGGTCERRDLGESCSDSNQCEDNNAECSSGSNRVCQCVSGYYDIQPGTVGGSCQKRNIGQTCSADNQCSNTANAQCSIGGTRICQCQSGYYSTGTGSSATCTKRRLGESCTATSQCSATNAECRSSTCWCMSGYYDTQPGNGGTCERRDLGESCSNNNQCNGNNVECTGTCSCVSTHYRDGNTCTLKKELGESGCLTSVTSCKDPQALCYMDGSLYVCRCNSIYYDNTGTTDIGGTCIQKVQLGYACPMPDACINVNSQCLGAVCKCLDNYYDDNTETQTSGNCQMRRALDGYCNPSSSLPANPEQCYENAICTYYNSAYRCRCKSNSHVEGSDCVQNKANGKNCNVLISNECSDPNAQCISSKCTCGTYYYDDNNLAEGGTCRDVVNLKVSGMTFPSIDVTTTSLTVKWTAPSTINFINNYKVLWSPYDNSQSPKTVNISAASTTISNLKPGRKNVFTIVSVNTGTQAGVERTTFVSQAQATKPNQPGPLNTHDVNYSVDADENDIYLVWIAPSNSEVTTYNIKVLDVTEQKYNRDTTDSQPRSQIYFSSIKHGYTYNIDIIAKSQTYGSKRESSSTFSTTIKTTVKAPGRPTNVQCGDTTDSCISLSWTAPGLTNGDLEQYMIKIYTVVPYLTFLHTVLTGNSNQEYTVPSLNPGSYYKFEVFTVNELYNSTSGQFSPNPYCATKAQSFSKPQTFSTSVINSRGFTNTWSEPANIASGELLGYVVQIKDGNACVLEQIYTCTDCTGSFDFTSLTNQCSGNVQTMTDKTKTQLSEVHIFTTTRLNPDILYTVTVSAINSEGKGYMAELTAMTFEEAPQKPTNVMTSVESSTTVDVTWSLAGPRPGVTTYTLMVEPVDTAAPTVTRTVPGFTNTSYMVTGLEEFWTYTVKVKVETSIGEKTSDASLEFKTLAAAPGPVDAFAIETPNGDYTKLKISWKTPTVLEKNGIIKSFNFTHNATELTSSVELASPERFAAKILDSYVYEKIVVVQPENIYKFEVYAVNEYDQQGYVTSEIKMAPAGVPQTPSNVEISDKRSTSVVVSWNIEGPRPGITTYTVMVNPENTAAYAVTQQVYGFANTSCTVIGLEEFWEYSAQVKMETPVGGATSDVTPVFKTLSAPPGPVDAFTIEGPFNGDFTQMQISWKIPTLLHRNGVIKALKIVHNATRTSTIESEETSTFPARQEDFIYSIIVDVIPKRTYSFQVYAINTEDMTGEITKETSVAPSPETETQPSSNIAVIIAAVLGGVVLLLIVALVIFIVRYKRLKVKRNSRQNSKPQAKTEENARFDNLAEVSIPVSGDYANNYMELDDTSRVDTYDKIAIGRPNVESSVTDTEQYEMPDVPSQNRWK